MAVDELAIGERFRALAGELDERRRPLGAAAQARSAGRGGIAATARATGMSEETVRRGVRELESGERLDRAGCAARAAGASGWPRPPRPCWMISSASWTASRAALPSCRCAGRRRSVRKLAEALGELGHRVHFTTVAKLLRGLGYSLQANPGGETAVRPPALMWDATLGV